MYAILELTLEEKRLFLVLCAARNPTLVCHTGDLRRAVLPIAALAYTAAAIGSIRLNWPRLPEVS
jgi:hypothetical protein